MSRRVFKMLPCSKIKIASLIIALLSLISTAYGCCMFTKYMVNVAFAIVKLIHEKTETPSSDIASIITDNGLHRNVLNAIMLSFLVIAFSFSIILTKGLLSKKAHLVKAYFVFGVTMTTMSGIFGLYLTLAISRKIGLLVLLGCVVYSLMLMIIRKTYLDIATAEKCSSSNTDEEKSTSIRL